MKIKLYNLWDIKIAIEFWTGEGITEEEVEELMWKVDQLDTCIACSKKHSKCNCDEGSDLCDLCDLCLDL